jgi:sulfotransferase
MCRAGSTLLQNILANNPDIYATPTSGLIELLLGSKRAYTESVTIRAQDSAAMKTAFLKYCRYAMEGYFSGLTQRQYVIDKSRDWAINRAFLHAFYPDPKILCIVRDLRDIVASMEKAYLKYPERFNLLFNENEIPPTIENRVQTWMTKKPVGTTLHNLRESIRRGYDKKMLFIRFEDLTRTPDAEMRRVYKYLGMPYYKHNFKNIKQMTHEDDRFHGIYGNHIISPAVKPVPSVAQELLGETICRRLHHDNKWYFDYFKYGS